MTYITIAIFVGVGVSLCTTLIDMCFAAAVEPTVVDSLLKTPGPHSITIAQLIQFNADSVALLSPITFDEHAQSRYLIEKTFTNVPFSMYPSYWQIFAELRPAHADLFYSISSRTCDLPRIRFSEEYCNLLLKFSIKTVGYDGTRFSTPWCVNEFLRFCHRCSITPESPAKLLIAALKEEVSDVEPHISVPHLIYYSFSLKVLCSFLFSGPGLLVMGFLVLIIGGYFDDSEESPLENQTKDVDSIVGVIENLPTIKKASLLDFDFIYLLPFSDLVLLPLSFSLFLILTAYCIIPTPRCFCCAPLRRLRDRFLVYFK